MFEESFLKFSTQPCKKKIQNTRNRFLNASNIKNKSFHFVQKFSELLTHQDLKFSQKIAS